MTPPPVVELLREAAQELARYYDDPEVGKPLLALADSLSALTPERVREVGNALSFAHWQSCAVHVDDPNSDNGPGPFETCTTCAGIREAFNALAALSDAPNGR